MIADVGFQTKNSLFAEILCFCLCVGILNVFEYFLLHCGSSLTFCFDDQ